MTLKQKVHAHYVQLVCDRIDAFRDMIAALTEDSKNDAKGSAGDKHETALSMMHLEQEKINRKLSEYCEQKAVLDRIDPDAVSERVVLGSLVKANQSYLYLSSAFPKVTIEGAVIIALSPQSPLGGMLIGKQAGHRFQINGTEYAISEIL